MGLGSGPVLQTNFLYRTIAGFEGSRQNGPGDFARRQVFRYCGSADQVGLRENCDRNGERGNGFEAGFGNLNLPTEPPCSLTQGPNGLFQWPHRHITKTRLPSKLRKVTRGTRSRLIREATPKKIPSTGPKPQEASAITTPIPVSIRIPITTPRIPE